MKELLETLIAGHDLTEGQAAELMRALADPTTHPAQAGAVLTALRVKGEVAAEIRGFAQAMRALAIAPEVPVADEAVDIVGTGGDGSGSLNLSTGAAILTAACGRTVIKHGNRSVSSLCGSADVLERLGYEFPNNPASVREDVAKHGFAFLFAPAFHPAMKAIAPVRRSLGVRTVFNLLGPLTNPAAPGYAIIGAPSPEIARLLAEAVSDMPIRRAFVVHGAEGWDEATPVGPFLRFDVRGGRVAEETVDATQFGLERCSASDLVGGTVDINAERLARALGGEPGPVLDTLALGAGLALEVAGHVNDLRTGIETARQVAIDGLATNLLKGLRGEIGVAAPQLRVRHA